MNKLSPSQESQLFAFSHPTHAVSAFADCPALAIKISPVADAAFSEAFALLKANDVSLSCLKLQDERERVRKRERERGREGEGRGGEGKFGTQQKTSC